MKKIIGIVMIIFLSSSIYAQEVGDSHLYTSQASTDYKKNSFGLDLGIGSVKNYKGTLGDLGVRWLHNFSPYVGWDIVGVKGITDFKDIEWDRINYQLMSGLRLKTPTFANGKMAGYVAGKAGYGFVKNGGGFCYELEIGMHLTRTFFIAFAYNHQGGSVETQVPYSYQQSYQERVYGYHYNTTTGKWVTEWYYQTKSRTINSTKTIKSDLDIKYSALRLGFNF